MKANTGFSLSELLLVLIILGNIAAFSIPKILNAQQSNQKKAIFKEIVGAVNDQLNSGLLTGELVPGANTTTYFVQKTNAVKICPTRADTEGCWAHPENTGMTQVDEPGYILHNGAVVAGFSNSGTTGEYFAIDWNGATGPNVHGDDQLVLRLIFQTSGGWRRGTIVVDSAQPESETLYYSLFN